MVDQYLQHLMALIGTNRIFASYEFMKSLPPNTPIPNKNNLFGELESKVNTARILTREVNGLLKKASYPKALDHLRKARQLVPDFPNIQNDIDFIEGTIVDLQQGLIAAEMAAKRGEKRKVREFLDSAYKIDGRNLDIARINKRLEKTVRRRKLRNILLTTLAILTPALYTGYEQYMFLECNARWAEAHSHIVRHEYQLARAEMDKIEQGLRNVRILNQIDKVKLLASVRSMAESTLFQQGLVGKVLHNGQFVERATKERSDQIVALRQTAELNVAAENWSAALNDYQQALSICRLDESQRGNDIAGLEAAILQVREAWNVEHQGEGRASFQAMASKGDLFYSERRWAEAMDSYGQALLFARANRVADYDEVSRISRARHGAEVNNCLEDAQGLMALNNEAEARLVFERIITLSEENGLTDHEAMTIAREMVAKIDKNVFVARVNGLEERAQTLAAEQKHQEALAHYHELLGELQGHGREFQLNVAGKEEMVIAAMAELNKELVVSNQYRYLLSAYQNILRKSFNLSANIHLQQPEIVFVRDDNNTLIYKVTALGAQNPNGSAPHTRYEIDYRFDKSTGDWALTDSPTS